jgi:TolA-binding protein
VHYSKKIIMTRTIRLLTLAAMSFLLGLSQLSAQQTVIYDEPDVSFREGQELFDKEKYGAAQEKFLNVVSRLQGNPSELLAQSEYYSAMCSLELFHNDASYRIVQYVRNHPEHTRVYLAWYQLARYYFRFKDYDRAMAAFEKVDQYKLNDAEKAEYQFKAGYCYFMKEDLEAAKKAFFTIKDGDSKYAAGATYYFAHICYLEKNYETALKAFRHITSDEVYGKYTPYYITQIYYIQQKYDQLLQVAPGLLDSASSKRAPEIARMIASSYFKTKKYSDALLYMDMYLQKAQTVPTRDDYYEMAYCYYRSNDPDKALEYFGKVNTDPKDTISQLTLYQSGDCSLQTGDALSAIHNFHMAYQMAVDPKVSENALFNYAKLAYEKGYNPYNEAIKSFQQYINEYPNSPNIDEAYEYLSGMYLSTHNYKDALNSLEAIKKRDVRLNKAYQKVTYFRGVEFYNDNKFPEAITLFAKSLSYPIDAPIAAQATYWKGEAYYQVARFDSSLINFQKFLRMPGAFGTPEYNLANYQIGYNFFKKKNYAQALVAFRKFTSAIKDEPPALVNDGYVRTADCFFMTKEYASAIEFYDKSMSVEEQDNDYAMYQKALALGPLGKFENKASVLAELTSKYPTSSYYDDALFESAATWQNLGNNAKAIASYDQLINNCPQSIFLSKALLKKGLIYYNAGEDEKALTVLQQVVADYRGTDESKEALMALQNVYVSMGKVSDWIAWVRNQGGDISDATQDSLTYIAVENKYMDHDCNSAIQGFGDYISRFPNGEFAIDAHFYKGECLYAAGTKAEALEDYKFVISKPISKYLETSLLKASEICYDQKNFNDAETYYKRLGEVAQYKNNILTARLGRMRCLAMLMRSQDAMDAAGVLLTTDKLPNDIEMEAHMVIARNALAMDSIALAVSEFAMVSKNSKGEYGAEARWNLGYIQYLQGNYDESEKTAFDLINQVPSYDYWVAKAFILLADNYVKKGNNRQAKYTLQSIIENYNGPDLVKIAQSKLNMIVEAEKQQELLNQQQQQQQQQNPDNPGDGKTPETTNPDKF